MRVSVITVMKICKECGKYIPRISSNANNVKFCSPKCRNKNTWRRVREKRLEEGRNKRGAYEKNKIQCLLCERWYVKVASHVFYTHHLTEDEYKSYFDLPLSKGIVPTWHKDELRRLALENKMDEQLKRVGQRTRYKKGDKRAKIVTGWKGRNGSKGFTDY